MYEPYHPTCTTCGQKFGSERWGTKYCSNKCRQLAYRKRILDRARAAREKRSAAAKKGARTRKARAT